MTGLFGTFVLFAASGLPVLGQSLVGERENPEAFRLEVMGSGWLLTSAGQIQASGTPADLVSDLGVRQNQATFYGRLVVKPARRHRIEIEGTPFQLNGLNTINRTILFQGRTFNVNQTVTSQATLDYLYAGYQLDVLTGSKGHLGFSIGGAYLDASGALQTAVSSVAGSNTVSASRSQKLGLPLAGVGFRVFPIPHHKLFEIEGQVRGMAFGSYGHYGQAMIQAGLNAGLFSLLAGYRAVNTSIYVNTSTNPSGITARLQGPLFSGVFRW